MDSRVRRFFATVRRVMHRLVLLWLCCALALSACTKPEEGSDLPPLASASPSGSPSPSKSATPVDAKAAIVALARAYFIEANLAIGTGNTSRLRALSIANCPCRAFANRVDADWNRGRVDSASFYTILDVRSPYFRDENTGVVTVFLRTNRYRVVDASGKVLADVAADTTTQSSSVNMSRINGAWKVANVVRL